MAPIISRRKTYGCPEKDRFEEQQLCSCNSAYFMPSGTEGYGWRIRRDSLTITTTRSTAICAPTITTAMTIIVTSLAIISEATGAS